MVYGKFGFPEWGMEGAAIANTTAETLSMLFILGTLIYHRKKDIYHVWSRLKIDGKQLLENLKVGFPLCLQGLLALSVWTVFFNWIEQMGKEDLSVSLNIRHIYFLAFVPIWGFAAATKTYIAQYIGARELDQLPVIQRRIQLMTVLFLLVTFHGAVLYPETLISMINENEEFVQKSAVILRLVAGSIVLYAIVSVYFQTIGASGNTRVTFLVECLSTFSYLLAAWLFIKQWHWDITYVWLVEYVYFIVMGAASIIYLKFFNWTKTELV
jgi:Na+-driven multidrug efflux pump